MREPERRSVLRSMVPMSRLEPLPRMSANTAIPDVKFSGLMKLYSEKAAQALVNRFEQGLGAKSTAHCTGGTGA